MVHDKSSYLIKIIIFISPIQNWLSEIILNRYVIEETLNISSGQARTTTANYDGLGNLTNITYSGGRNLSYNYDALNRISDIVENIANVVEYDYIGSRVEQIRFLNGT